MGDGKITFYELNGIKHCHLLNSHVVNDVWQTEMYTATDYQHTAEPLVSESRSFEVEIDTEKLKIFKSPGSGQFRKN
jgi:hypothetical protein